MKRKYEEISSKSTTQSILFCGHASWNDKYGTTIIPENTQLYVYAPQGSALSQQVARAISAGEQIKKGDLQFRRISPITLFNLGYEDRGEGVGQYEPKILSDYPLCLEYGQEITNYRMFSPGKNSLQSGHEDLFVLNIDEPGGIFLGDLLQKNKGKTCHFGGCSWVTSEFDKRNEEEKRQLRKERFNSK